jgi:O-methyltransferase involved in polyketide biosynthesis
MLPGVSKTAILTLRARADEHLRADRVFEDPLAVEWWTRVSWPPELDRWYQPQARDALAFRADDIDRILAQYFSIEEPSTVIELGCGLSTRRSRLAGLPIQRWVDLDLPEVVALRRAWGIDSEQIASSVLDHAWMDRLGRSAPDRHLFIAEGLFYYLPRAEVDALFLELRRRFPGSAIIFDVVGINDYATLLENTKSAGTPIVWKLENDYANVLAEFGLSVIDALDPDRLMDEALMRYWDRFDAKLQGAIYFVMSSDLLRRGRSGTVLGRL